MIAIEQIVQSLPLSLLKRNEEAKVVEIVGESCCIHRLEEMGFRQGAHLRMVTPGTPCIVSLDGRRISLRIDCDAEVIVQPLPFNSAETRSLQVKSFEGKSFEGNVRDNVASILR